MNCNLGMDIDSKIHNLPEGMGLEIAALANSLMEDFEIETGKRADQVSNEELETYFTKKYNQAMYGEENA